VGVNDSAMLAALSEAALIIRPADVGASVGEPVAFTRCIFEMAHFDTLDNTLFVS
jgi:hypothetical protein